MATTSTISHADHYAAQHAKNIEAYHNPLIPRPAEWMDSYFPPCPSLSEQISLSPHSKIGGHGFHQSEKRTVPAARFNAGRHAQGIRALTEDAGVHSIEARHRTAYDSDTDMAPVFLAAPFGATSASGKERKHRSRSSRQAPPVGTISSSLYRGRAHPIASSQTSHFSDDSSSEEEDDDNDADDTDYHSMFPSGSESSPSAMRSEHTGSSRVAWPRRPVDAPVIGSESPYVPPTNSFGRRQRSTAVSIPCEAMPTAMPIWTSTATSHARRATVAGDDEDQDRRGLQHSIYQWQANVQAHHRGNDRSHLARSSTMHRSSEGVLPSLDAFRVYIAPHEQEAEAAAAAAHYATIMAMA